MYLMSREKVPYLHMIHTKISMFIKLLISFRVLVFFPVVCDKYLRFILIKKSILKRSITKASVCYSE